jgi:hypothetical protein
MPPLLRHAFAAAFHAATLRQHFRLPLMRYAYAMPPLRAIWLIAMPYFRRQPLR